MERFLISHPFVTFTKSSTKNWAIPPSCNILKQNFSEFANFFDFLFEVFLFCADIITYSSDLPHKAFVMYKCEYESKTQVSYWKYFRFSQSSIDDHSFRVVSLDCIIIQFRANCSRELEKYDINFETLIRKHKFFLIFLI